MPRGDHDHHDHHDHHGHQRHGCGGSRTVYLEHRSVEEAQALWRSATASYEIAGPIERVPVVASRGRVTARPVFAAVSSPFYHSAAMDGFAVHHTVTFGASETTPKRLQIGRDAIPVDTGDPLPPGTNAVIMVEDVHPTAPDEIEIIAAVAPWQHVRPVGEDIVATELILPENHQIRPADIGAMLAAGLTEVDVRRRPRLAIIPTGSELVQPGEPLQRGAIIEYNSQVLANMAVDWGAEPHPFPPVPDDFAAIKAALLKAVADYDVIVINAGSSAGREDYTRPVIAELGTIVLHGVKLRPGSPVLLGIIQGKPVLGIPGYPVSAMLTFELFGKELITRLSGVRLPPPPQTTAIISHKIASPLGQEEFLRVKLGRVGDRLIAAPIARGAGVLMSMVRADGIVRIPANSEGVQAGQTVVVELFKPLDDVDNTIVAIGSHDPVLDLLASELKKRYPALSLSSAHVGSMGGLLALKRGEAHLAGTHLLDEATGEYNVPYVRRLLPERSIVLVNLVYRQQGLMVPKGNPKGITSLADLARPDVAFVNRQRGSGTRVLLDYKLKQLGIAPEAITGYGREEYTHLAVAAAVASGVADAGLGVLSAARALGLDFIPVAMEQYDLAIPAEFFDQPLIQRLIEVITSPSFQTRVEALGGYDLRDAGTVVARIPA